MRHLSISILLLTVAILSAPAQDVPYVAEQLCCLLEGGEDIEQVNERWGTTTLHSVTGEDFYLLKAVGIADLPEFAALMTTDPAVHIAEPNYVIESPEAVRQMVIAAIGGTWDDFADQTAMQRIALDEAHQVSRGTGVTIAVLDTGIDFDHPALAGHIGDWSYDYVDEDQDPSESANGLDDDEDGTTDEGYGHGTMVAGLIALIAPEAEIMPLRVLNDEGLGTIFDVARAMTHATAHGAQILNMSFGAPQHMQTIYQRFHVTEAHGGTCICGAGNRDVELPALYPAIDPRAIMVTGLDSADVKADFADYHTHVLVAAPGVGIRSAYPGDEWALGSGCSFATPIIAGAAGLILSLGEDMETEDLRARLHQGVDPIYGIPENQPYLNRLGGGRINLVAALSGGAQASVDPVDGHLGLRIWPNPSAGGVHFSIPSIAGGSAEVAILDATGRSVSRIPLSPGQVATWDGRLSNGTYAPTGIYWARMRAGRSRDTSMLTLIR